jgi:cell division protein FtsZ
VVLANVAKDAGAVVLVFAALPFACEGNRRQRLALDGLRELQALADGVFCMPNQELLNLIDDTTSVVETFRRSDALLAEGVFSVWRLIACKGLIELHFADLCSFLRESRGQCRFAGAESSGPMRAREVIDRLVSHPMLEGGRILEAAEAVLVSLVGGPDLTMVEVDRVMEHINVGCARAQIMMGAAVDPQMEGRLAVTLVVTAHPETRDAPAPSAAIFQENVEDRPAGPIPSRLSSTRSDPRAGGAPAQPNVAGVDYPRRPVSAPRQRASGPRMRQGQLPLEIISRGRFDKSEPTIHKGEDLDVPTYIRRGVALN